MVKFNTGNEGLRATQNYMGEDAYILHPEERLLNLCATCLWGEPKYYGGSQVYNDILELANKVDAEYVLQLAWYLREELYLRTIPMVLTSVVAHRDDIRGIKTTLLKAYLPHIIQRADEINEIIACYNEMYCKDKKEPIPNALKKSLKNIFESEKFDEYQYAKYDGENKVKFKDVIRIAHPSKPQKILKEILTETLPTPYTWEVELSKRGNTAEVWHELIDSRKVGYMALLRNLANMIKAGIDYEHAVKVASTIANQKNVMESKQFPFRFLSAYEKISELDSDEKVLKYEKENSGSIVKMFKSALNEAVEISAKNNIPKFEGKTIIICDNSGSARGDFGGASQISFKSVRSMADAGNMLGLLAWYGSENTIFGVFGDNLIILKPDRNKGVLENFEAVDNAGKGAGASTEQGVFTMLGYMIKDKIWADRLIVCSDLQIGDGNNSEYGLGGRIHPSVPELVKEYRKTVNPKFWYHSISFNGYGTNVIEGQRNTLTQGWNDRIFQYLKLIEEDKSTQLKTIKERWVA